MGGRPLVRCFEEIRPAAAHVAMALGPPGGEGWLRLDDVAAVPELLATVAPPADHGAALVASAVAGSVVTVAWLPLLVHRRVPLLRADAMWLRRHEEGWVDAIRLADGQVAVLADDPDAGHPEAVVVGSAAELQRTFAEAIVAVVGPWFDALRAARVPFGRRGMWGQLADEVCGSALRAARELGLDEHRAWRRAHAALDVVAAAAGDVRVRPSPFPVRWPGGSALFQVKGTCCLWHKGPGAAEQGEARWCSSCPLRDDESRHARLSAWMAERAVG